MKTPNSIWACVIATWTLEYLRYVVWSNELWFQLFWAVGRVHVWYRSPWCHGSLLSTRHHAGWWRGVFMWYGFVLLGYLDMSLTSNCSALWPFTPIHGLQQWWVISAEKSSHWGPIYPKLVWGAFWRLSTNSVVTMFAEHELYQAFIGCGVEVCLHAGSYNLKISWSMVQHL